MKALTGQAFARLAETRGWRLLRINGSHHIYGKLGEAARLTIPVRGRQTLKIGLQRSLMKIVGLTDADIV